MDLQFEIRGSTLAAMSKQGISASGNVIHVFGDRVECAKAIGFRREKQVIAFDQVAQVAMSSGPVWTTFIVESTGGHRIEAVGLKADEASRFKERLEALIRDRRTANQPRTGDPNIPEQIRDLAELHKHGALTEDEFQAAKAELLRRI